MESRFDQARVQTYSQPASRDRSEHEADRVASQIFQPARFRQHEAAATQRPADLNFDRVRIHADEPAATSARSVHALAYTVGQDIVFAAGQYQPASTLGKQLIAHELAHVMQQRSQIALQRQPAPDPKAPTAPTEQDLLAAFQEFKLKHGKEPGKELQDWARQYQIATGEKITFGKLEEAREFRRIWQQYPKLPQKAEAQPKDAKLPADDIGANEVLPFAKGTRVLITQLIDRVISKSLLERAADFFNKDKSSSSSSNLEDNIPLLIDLFTDPNVTKSVTATILESTPQQVVVSVDIPKIPAKGTRPELAAMTAKLMLKHTDPRSFDLMIEWQRDGSPSRIAIGGVGAERGANGNILVSRKGDSIKLELARGAGGQIGAQLVNLPALARMLVGEPVKLIQMEPLSASVGSAEATKSRNLELPQRDRRQHHLAGTNFCLALASSLIRDRALMRSIQSAGDLRSSRWAN
ncbi:MAG: DUF4157 domain-containing protein [Leptolyngbyaceae cyanobacterium SM1_3_5]|nr:DUF4157 domain-containing protein [Leptolyngbyaceae cyanobacterium SM1_3_5]